MDATRLGWGVVNQVSIMSTTTTAIDPRFELTYIPQWSGKVSCYMVAVPKELGSKLCQYLQDHGCKFQQRFSILRHKRCEFFIEKVGNPKLIDALAARTVANGGKVSLPAVKLDSPQIPGFEVDLFVCPLTQDQVLTVKLNGSESFDFDAIPNLDIKLASFLRMAIAGIERDIVYECQGKDERILDVFRDCGFTYCPDDIDTMRYFNT